MFSIHNPLISLHFYTRSPNLYIFLIKKIEIQEFKFKFKLGKGIYILKILLNLIKIYKYIKIIL